MILEKINSPRDLKRLSLRELRLLAKELRVKIIEVVSKTGGHLASNLGNVELSLALHYCLNAPKDIIIWDVGHQVYTHKLLTGRRKEFQTLRQLDGLSGFPSKDESVYDPFSTGHSSTAISLALGMAVAEELKQTNKEAKKPTNQKTKIVAVIGDGSLSGGLCFEALNNLGHLKKDVLVILNTNEMSIAPVVGALSTYINKIISLPIYNRFREALEGFIQARIPKGRRLLKLADKFEEGLKGLFIPGIFFEELGFRYFGPLDGHNLDVLISTLKNLLKLSGPLILHVVTKKGKGYRFAQESPIKFHSTKPFEIKSGKTIVSQPHPSLTYTQVFSKKLVELAGQDKKILAITAAMPEGTGLDRFRDRYPERFFDVGIAESHALVFAAGLARGGFKPIIAIYSTFLQRAYDQLLEEFALQELPVVLVIDRAGIVGEDGVTHQGIFDLVYLRHIPNIAVIAPKDGEELEMMLEFALNYDRPVALRFPKDVVPSSSVSALTKTLKIQEGKAEILREGKDLAIVSLGAMVYPSLEAAALLAKEGLEAAVINARFLKPLDEGLLAELGMKFKKIVTVEEGILEGGFGSAILELFEKKNINTPGIKRIGLPSQFIPHGSRGELLERYGLTPKRIAEAIKSA